jgi:PilZ domain-containing protein
MSVFARQRTQRSERRIAERVAMDASVEISVGLIILTGRVENMSVTGAAVIVPGSEAPPFASGDAVSLRLPRGGEGGADFVIEGRIVRAESLCGAQGDSTGYGIEFDQPLEE